MNSIARLSITTLACLALGLSGELAATKPQSKPQLKPVKSAGQPAASRTAAPAVAENKAFTSIYELDVKATVLGKVPQDARTYLDPTQSRLLFQSGGTFCMDGTTSEGYVSDVTFSEDGKHVLYMLQISGDSRLYLDGKPYGDCKRVSRFGFVPGSSIPWVDGDFSLWIDGIEQEKISNRRGLTGFGGNVVIMADDRLMSGGNVLLVKSPMNVCFSPDGKKMAWITCESSSPDRYQVWVNGKAAGKQYKAVSQVVFSPNSEHYAYRAETDLDGFVVVDGTEVAGDYPSVSSMWNDGRGDGSSRPVSLFVSDDGKTTLSIEGGIYGEVWINGKQVWSGGNLEGFVVSPDRKHWVMLQNEGMDGSVPVIDGQPEPSGHRYSTLLTANNGATYVAWRIETNPTFALSFDVNGRRFSYPLDGASVSALPKMLDANTIGFVVRKQAGGHEHWTAVKARIINQGGSRK